MAKKKQSGLHKEISTIFDGIPVPNDEGKVDSADTLTMDRRAGCIPPAPKVAANRIAQSALKQDKVVESAVNPKTQKIQVPKEPKRTAFEGLNKFVGQISAKLFAPKPGVSPAKQKMTVVLMPLLIIVAVFVLGRNFTGSGKNKKAKPQDGFLSPKTASAKKEIDWQRPAPYPENLRDPMQKYTVSLARTDATQGDIIVRGIVWSKDAPSAVIGTEILYVDEMIHGAKITKISKGSVEFEREGKTWTQKVAGY